MTYDRIKLELAEALAMVEYFYKTEAKYDEKRGHYTIQAPPQECFLKHSLSQMPLKIPELAKLVAIKMAEVQLQQAKDQEPK